MATLAKGSAAFHRQQAAALYERCKEINGRKNDEGFLSGEDQTEWEATFADFEKHKAEYERIEAFENLAPKLRTSPIDPDASGRGNEKIRMVSVRKGSKYIERPASHTAEYHDAWLAYLSMGQVSAALQTDHATQAGYFVADEVFAADLLKAVDDMLFIRQIARVRTVIGAKSLGIRKRTAKAATWSWGPELATPTADSTYALGKKVLTPHYASGSILVSNDLLRQSQMAEAEVIEEMAVTGSELMEDGYLTGDGQEKPLGVFTASTDGISTSRDVVTGSNTDFTKNGLLEAKYSLKERYMRSPRTCWIMHRDAIKRIAKLEDGQNQPIFRVGVGRMQDNAPPEDNLLGYPVKMSERAPNTFTAGNYGAVLGDFFYYEIADALDMELQRLNELNARTNQVEFLARLKTDGMPTLEEAFVRLKFGT